MVLIMPTATRRPVVPDGSQPTVGKVKESVNFVYGIMRFFILEKEKTS